MSGSPGGMGMGPTGEGEPPCMACAQGQLSGDTWAKGRETWPHTKPCPGQKEPFCRAGNFLPGAHPGNRVMLNLLLSLGKRAGGCRLGEQ